MATKRRTAQQRRADERRQREEDRRWVQEEGMRIVRDLTTLGLHTSAQILEREIARYTRSRRQGLPPNVLAAAILGERAVMQARRGVTQTIENTGNTGAYEDQGLSASNTNVSNTPKDGASRGGGGGHPGGPSDDGGAPDRIHSDTRAKNTPHNGVSPWNTVEPLKLREVAPIEEEEAPIEERMSLVKWDRDLLFEEVELSRDQRAALKRGCVTSRDLRAWMELWGLDFRSAARILRTSPTTVKGWWWKRLVPIRGMVGRRLEGVRLRDKWEVLRELAREDGSTDEKGRVEFKVEVDWRAASMYRAMNFGLDPLDVQVFRFWSSHQRRHGEALRKVRRMQARGEEPGTKLVYELDRMRRYQIHAPAGCAVLHVPSNVVERSEAKPHFYKNRDEAWRRLRWAVQAKDREMQIAGVEVDRVHSGVELDSEAVEARLGAAIEAARESAG